MKAKLFTCPNGHQWHPVEDEASSGGVSTTVCPVCGTLPVPDSMDAAAHDVDHSDSQVSTAFDDEPPRASEKKAGNAKIYVPGYEILKEIGRGGMGVVYKARQISHDRLVAIKVIRTDRLVHEDAVRRFRREAQAAYRLGHPNVVLVYDSDMDGELHYLVMEYVPGHTLQKLVERGGPLDVRQGCDLIRQAALGLQHVYDQGMVHRDIKPSNLMITEVGGARTRKMLKILDMGVARLFQVGSESPVESLSTLTQPGAVLGTADFIAPEQLEDPSAADCRADLYSLGCTFYYLLIGQVPFPGGSLIQKMDRQRWQTPVGVHQLRPDVSSDVSAIVRKLMAKKPGERYQSPGALAGDLKKAAGGGRIVVSRGVAPVREIRRFTGHDDAVWSVAFAPDGKTAVSGSKDRTIRIWDAATGKELKQLPKRSQEVRSVTVSHDGRFVLTASGVSLRVWDFESGKEVLTFTGHTDTIRNAVFTADDRRVVSCSDDRTVRVWDVHTGRELVRFARHRGAVNDVALTHDGRQILSGGHEPRLRFWNVHNGQENAALKTPVGQVLSVALSPNGHFALSAHFDTALRLWDLHAGRELRRLEGHKQMATAVAFTADGKHMLSGSKDQTVRLWETDNGAEVAFCRAHSGGVTHVCVSPIAVTALSAGMDREICLWALPE